MADELQFEKFRERGVAPLLTEFDIATVLGIGPKLIVSMLKKPNRHYRTFPLTKKDGSERQISAPRTYLKVAQWWILDNIVSRVPASENVFGFCRGRSIQDNARYHLGSTHILNVDIKSFFDSVTFSQVLLVFKELGYSQPAAKTLAGLCTLNGKLPQGAPTSPNIANMVLSKVDRELEALASSVGSKYSRYADDITFSADDYISEQFQVRVEDVVKSAGFELKASKTRYAGTGSRREVTGLICGTFVQPPIEWRKLNRARLHNLGKKPVLEKSDIAYLLGLRGYSMQFPDAVQMQALLAGADKLLLSTKKPVPET
ncbi:retron St85 family RNA-directed DNA polymerase [Pelagimonas varians]|nr:retron St85 family RNA-directed DNA polymerase [Pelagimonas varians]